jgi:putative glutamine amidotransferase
MKKPWIGIPTRYHEKSQYIGQLRHYLEAILWAGGLPLLIPTVRDEEVLKSYTERIDGVLLPGSPTDVDPQLYGAAPHPQLGKLYPERDKTDFTLLDYAEKHDRPLLGICFGVQSLNVYRGGSLLQDIPALVADAVAHDTEDAADSPADPARHMVRLSPESLIARLAGKNEVIVNSYHHQAVQHTGQNLRPVALAPDGVVEAVEDTRGKFVVGVQWHPERGFETDPLSQALFKSFIEAAML